MANVKTVVVQLRDFNCLIQFQPSDNGPRTKQEILIPRIHVRDEFGARIARDDCLTLQIQLKIENFKGLSMGTAMQLLFFVLWTVPRPRANL